MSGSGQTDVAGRITDALPMGAALGLGAFVVNYVLIFLFVTADGADLSSGSSWKAVGWVFFNAHNVPVTAMGQSQNMLAAGATGAGATVPTLVYYIAPVVVLLAAGYFVAKSADAFDPVSGAASGGTLVAGYVILAVLGTFLFSVSMLGVAIAPDTVMGVLLAGIAYPLIGGAVGGAIAGAT